MINDRLLMIKLANVINFKHAGENNDMHAGIVEN
jgi:hypothetical protein